MQLTRRGFFGITMSAIASLATGALTACGGSQNVGTTTSDTDEYSQVEEITITDVTVTFPPIYFEGQTEEEATAALQELGATDITPNDDGSYTVTMPSDKYGELVDSIHDSVAGALEAMPASDDYPNVEGVDFDDQFTQVTLHMSVTELGLDDIFTPYVPGMYAAMYQQIAARPVDCLVTVLDPDGNEIITLDFPECLEEQSEVSE